MGKGISSLLVLERAREEVGVVQEVTEIGRVRGWKVYAREVGRWDEERPF